MLVDVSQASPVWSHGVISRHRRHPGHAPSRKGTSGIAGELTARGVVTKHGNGHWSHQAVARIVKRRARAEA